MHDAHFNTLVSSLHVKYSQSTANVTTKTS